MEYPHPLDLIVNSRISAQIESGTVLTFTADTSINKDDFTVKYLPDDGHNDDAIQLGLENVRYALSNDAIAITFERVSSFLLCTFVRISMIHTRTLHYILELLQMVLCLYYYKSHQFHVRFCWCPVPV